MVQDNEVLMQTTQVPLQSLTEIDEHLEDLSKRGVEWQEVALLMDDPQYNSIVCLVSDGGEIQAAMRINMPPDDALKAGMPYKNKDDLVSRGYTVVAMPF